MCAYSRFFNFSLFSLLFWNSLIWKRDDGFSWNIFILYVVNSGDFDLVLSLQLWCVCLLFISFAINCLYIELLSFNSYIFVIFSETSLSLSATGTVWMLIWFQLPLPLLLVWCEKSEHKPHHFSSVSFSLRFVWCYKMNCFYFLSFGVAKRECTSENYVVWLIRQVHSM